MISNKQEINDILYMIRPFWHYDKIWVILELVLACIGNTFNNLSGLIITWITIFIAENGNMSLTNIALIIILVLSVGYLFDLISQFITTVILEPKRERVKMKINIEVFNKLKMTDYKYFDDPQFFDYYTVTYGNYAEKAQDAIYELVEMISDAFTVSALIAFIVVQNWVVILVSFFNMVIDLIIGVKSNKLSIARDDSVSRNNREIEYYYDVLTGRDSAIDIKASYLSNLITDKYNKVFNNNIKTNKKYDIKSNILTFTTYINEFGAIAVIRILTCVLVLAGRVSIGSLVVLTSASSELSTKLSVFSRHFNSFHKVAIDGERIRKFLELSSPIEQSQLISSDKKEVVGKFDISFENVSFSYPNSDFKLDNINMHFKSGEKIAIVGENGGGKTTITKLLLRLYDPQEGEILLNGRPLKEYDVNSLRKQIGIAFQDCPIYSLTLRENLSVYNYVDDKSLEKISETLSINDILRKNDANYDRQITRLFDERGIVLSGGEKQKLSVARVMTKKFGLLIFDEPTAALDPLSESKLNEVILSSGNISTTVLISHRLSNVINSDMIYVIKEGRIIESGTHKELMSLNGYYSEMFYKQSKKYRMV